MESHTWTNRTGAWSSSRVWSRRAPLAPWRSKERIFSTIRDDFNWRRSITRIQKFLNIRNINEEGNTCGLCSFGNPCNQKLRLSQWQPKKCEEWSVHAMNLVYTLFANYFKYQRFASKYLWPVIFDDNPMLVAAKHNENQSKTNTIVSSYTETVLHKACMHLKCKFATQKDSMKAPPWEDSQGKQQQPPSCPLSQPPCSSPCFNTPHLFSQRYNK